MIEKKGFFAAGKEHKRREAQMRANTYTLFGDVVCEIFIGPNYNYISFANKKMTFLRFVDYFFGHNDADEKPISTWEYVRYGATRAFRTIHNIAKLPVLALGLIDRGFQQLEVSLTQAYENNNDIVAGAVWALSWIPWAISKATKVGFLVASAAIDWENSYTRAKMRDQEGWTGGKPSNRFGWRILSVLTTGIALAVATFFSGGLAAVGALTGTGLAGSAVISGAAIGTTMGIASLNEIPNKTKGGLFAKGKAHLAREEAIKSKKYSVFGDVFREIFIGPDHAHLKTLNMEQYEQNNDFTLQKRIKASQQPLTFNRVLSYVFGKNDADKSAQTTWEYIKRGISRAGRFIHNLLRLATVFPLGLIDRGCQKLDVTLMQTSKKLWKDNHGMLSSLVGMAALIPRIVSKVFKVGFLVASATVEWNNSFKRAEMRDAETGTGVFWRAASVITSFVSWVGASFMTGGGAAIPAVMALGANVVGASGIAIAPTATISIPSMAIPRAATNAIGLGHITTPAAKIAFHTTYCTVLGACPPVVGCTINVAKNLTESKETANPLSNGNNRPFRSAININNDLDSSTEEKSNDSHSQYIM